MLGDEADAEGERDVDASVRALRPRSSRRGSWASEASGWSAMVGNGSVSGIGPGTASALKDRSTRTGSVKMENGDDEDDDCEASASPDDIRSKEEECEPPFTAGAGYG